MTAINNTHTPKIFLYSLLFPVIYLLFFYIANNIQLFVPSGLYGYIVLNSTVQFILSLYIFHLCLIISITLVPVCWYFAKTFQRHFTHKEQTRFTIYFVLWAFICASSDKVIVLYLIDIPPNQIFDIALGFIMSFFGNFLITIVAMFFIPVYVMNYFLKDKKQLKPVEDV